jgi:hypothetical protein
MAIRNQNWYNLNESRDYPLDDTASAVSDSEERLPQNIISDMRVRWPDWAGKYAFLGSVAVTSGAVTVTVLVAPDLENVLSDYIPIGVTSVPLASLEEGRQYSLESMYPGAFGYVVFGSGVLNNYNGRFAKPEQTLLAPRAARPHAGLSVTGLGKLYDQVPLTGLVTLNAADPLQITHDERTIDGVVRDAIIFSLVEETDTVDSASAFTSVFEAMSGPCGKRPESGNCGTPAPIEYINAVPPDCDGVVEIEFKGCAVIGRNTDDCSIIIDCDMGTSDTCEPPFIPTLAGLLPSEFTPVIPTPPIPPEPTPIPEDSISEPVIIPPGGLPYCDNFGDQIADDFSVVGGAWTFDSEISEEDLCPWLSVSDSESISDSGVSSYSYSTDNGTGISSRNMSIWTPDTQTIHRLYQTDLLIRDGTTAPGYNGGILVNYRVGSDGAKTFWLGHIDLSTTPARFSLNYFNGLFMTELVGQDYYLAKESWYRISMEVAPDSPSGETVYINLRCQLDGIDDPTVSIVLGPHRVPVSSYIPDSELAGFHSHQSSTLFSFWRVDEA